MTDRPPPTIEQLHTVRTGRVAVRGPLGDRDRCAELWIVLHGYAQLAANFVSGLDVLDDGTRLLVAPEALSRFYDATGTRRSHAEAPVGASWMTREDRASEIEDQAEWLDRVLAAYRPRVAPGAPLVVLGFSQGAAAASRWIGRRDVAVSHLICWGASIAPELPLDRESVLGRTRCTIVIGERDQFIDADQVRAERARLDGAGFRYAFESFAGGHRLDDATLRRVAGA